MGEETAGGDNSRVYTKLALCGQGSRDTGGQRERAGGRRRQQGSSVSPLIRPAVGTMSPTTKSF